MNQSPANSQQPQNPLHRSLAEWITFTIASLILLAIAGLVVYEWLATEKEPPLLSVTTNAAPREDQGNYYIPFTVANTGGETAESVQVIAELRVNGEVEEAGEQQIDFLSGGETEAGAFIFTRNPRDGELVLRVASYKLP
ncbi:MAG TPA: TIGR02588 family protein [Allocoleopsis sp.]